MIWLLPWDSDNPSRHWPWATWALMAINIAAFLLMPGGSEEQVEAWYREWGLASGEWHWYQFITSSFMHFGWGHLVGNMVFLWIFGDNVEDALGILGFLVLYFAGGILGDVLYVVANESDVVGAGASGCIATIAGAYAVLFFSRLIALKLIFVVFPVYTFNLRAFWLLVLWFGYDIFRTVDGGGELPEGGGTNFVVHAVGFAVGAAVATWAVLIGTMRRYELLANGDTWWGYVPTRLELEHRRRVAKAMQRERSKMIGGEWPS